MSTEGNRLGDLQMRRGTSDAAKLGDADEVVQAAQLHDRAISRPAAHFTKAA